MNAIYSITTHREKASEAAQVWRELKVCAVGWSRFGKFTDIKTERLPKEVQLFLQVKKGDLILAYATGNRIASVGEIETGEYVYTQENRLGLDQKSGGLNSPNQYRVKWLEKPHNFSRKDLPPWLSEQLGKRGKTIIRIDLNRRSFDQVKQIILTNPRSDSFSSEINEDTVKAGIRKYLRRNLGQLEEGLEIIDAEEATSSADRPDFIAKDRNNRKVIIECKGHAYADACAQLQRYGGTLDKENPRLMLIAFKIDDECMKEAKKDEKMELFECDLSFSRIFPLINNATYN